MVFRILLDLSPIFTNLAPLVRVRLGGTMSIYINTPSPPPDSSKPLVHMTRPPILWSLVLDCTQVSFTCWRCSTSGSSTLGAIKTRSCSRLDLWVVLAWSLKNVELFQIGLVDHPCVAGFGLLDCPCVEPYKLGGVLDPLILFVV